MTKESTCCFIGHRDCPGIEDAIYQTIERLMEHNIQYFLSGGMGNFDWLCERAVKKAKGSLIYVPYNHARRIDNHDRYYADIIYPNSNTFYTRYDIPKRNFWMVDHACVALCYVTRAGNAMKTYEYAYKKGLKVINLANQ